MMVSYEINSSNKEIFSRYCRVYGRRKTKLLFSGNEYSTSSTKIEIDIVVLD